MNNLIFYFDGLPQNLNDFEGTQSASFVFRRKTEGGESAFSFAPELSLTGAAYDYVRQQIINAPNPNLAKIDVEIYDTCCTGGTGSPRLLFQGRIEGADVRWCTVPTCQVDVTIIDNSQDAEAIRCLKNHFPFDTQNRDGSITTIGYNTFRYAPDINYCDDLKPSSMREAMLIFGIWLSAIAIPLQIVFSILNVISGLNINILQDIAELVRGCNGKHLAPFVDSQLRNLCLLCNLNYQSSLFALGGYYHNTVRLDTPYIPNTKNPITAYETNKPNLNGVQFLDQFKQLNIDWRVLNGSLIVERKDFFNGVEWFDISTIPESQILSICYDSTGDKPAAYAEYMYARDGVDGSGDEVLPKWSDRAIDWNPTNNPIQIGLFSKTLTFGAAQFRDDFYANDVNPIDKVIYQAILPAEPVDIYHAMFLTRGTTSFPKLLNLSSVEYDTSSSSNTLINRGYGLVDRLSAPDSKSIYNYKWHIKEQPYTDSFGNTFNTAYQTLLEIDDPRATTTKTRKVTLSITADCNLLNTLDVDKYITTPEGQVEIKEITYDTNNNSLTISGLI